MATIGTAGARARSAEQTRGTIVSAARTLFVERGYRAVSLRDVATAAGLSHPGLLRHFPAKDALLAAVVAELEDETQTRATSRLDADEPGTPMYAEIARVNASIPGYLPLFGALTGEASTATHPAHAYMRARYETVRETTIDSLSESMAMGVVAGDRDLVDETIRLDAGWDGLQVLQQYLPERIDVATALEQHQARLTLPRGWRDPDEPAPAASATPSPVPDMPHFAVDDDTDSGYRPGRDTRARIIDGAMTLFAQSGYGDTSLRDIAAGVGVSKSTLLHHFASKEALLLEVAAQRDRQISARDSYSRASRAADELRFLPVGAAENSEREPGLIEVYAVLSCEALPAEHPAHEYFARRYADTIDHFAALLRGAQADGDLPADRDPEFEAVWLTALWDGLQYQWLYDRDAVDIAAQLRAHLDDVMPPR